MIVQTWQEQGNKIKLDYSVIYALQQIRKCENSDKLRFNYRSDKNSRSIE